MDWGPLDRKIAGRVADIKTTGLVALNSVLLTDGLALRVTNSHQQQRPIQLIFFLPLINFVERFIIGSQ